MAAPTSAVQANNRLNGPQLTTTRRGGEMTSVRTFGRTHRPLIAAPMSQTRTTVQESRRVQTKLLTVCMAAPKRVAMVSKQLEREIGGMLLTDKVLQAAVCPERKRGIDTYLSAIASVTEVEISRDLQVAKVYVSIYSDDTGKKTAFDALKKLEGYVRKGVGRRIRLRMTPEIHFILDDSFDRSQRVLSLLNQIKEGSNPPPRIAVPGDDDDGEGSFEGDEYMDLVQEFGSENGSTPDATTKEHSDALVNDFLGGAGNGFADLYASNKPARGGKGRVGNRTGKGFKGRKDGR